MFSKKLICYVMGGISLISRLELFVLVLVGGEKKLR